MSVLNFALQVLVRHHAPEECLTFVGNILRPFGTRYVYQWYRDRNSRCIHVHGYGLVALYNGYHVGEIEIVKHYVDRLSISIRSSKSYKHTYGQSSDLATAALLHHSHFLIPKASGAIRTCTSSPQNERHDPWAKLCRK